MRAARFDSVRYRFKNLHGFCLEKVFSLGQNFGSDQFAWQTFIGKNNLSLMKAESRARINYFFYSEFHEF